MKTYQIGTHSIHVHKAPFNETENQRPNVAESFYRLLNHTQPAIGQKLEIERDNKLSEPGQAEQVARLKPAAMDALGQSAQNLMAGKNSLARLENEMNSLEPENAQGPTDLHRDFEVRACWRDLGEPGQMEMAKAALDAPRDYEGVLMALQASPWPLDLQGGAGEIIEAASLKLAKLRSPEQVERIEYLRQSIEWVGKASAQMATILKSELRISDADLLAHFIEKNDNATLEALGFEAATIAETQTRLKAA